MSASSSRTSNLLLLAVALCCAPEARACTCFGGTSPKKELRQCDAVFTGRPVRHRIITVDRTRTGETRGRVREFTFEVDSLWKGGLSRRATILTGMTSGECGYDFDLRVPYIVYARRAEGRLYTTICDLTKPLNNARQDLKTLGPAKSLK